MMTHLNGIRAVAYSRIRYVGNYDYEWTSLQREVLTDRVPYDGLFYSRNELLVPEMEATVE